MSVESTISVVVPIYNEAPNIKPLYEAIDGVFSAEQQPYELVLVDDGSTDDTEAILDALSKNHPQVKVLHLARNFGKEIALTAGLQHATGDAAIMLDADLQHPPSYIPEFIKKWHDGADVVIGVRKGSGKESRLIAAGSVIFYKLLNMLSDVPVVPHSTDFRLIDRQVIDQFARFTEHNRMLRGLIDWLGFKRDYVHFNVDARHAGNKTYNTRKLFLLAINSFISMSLTPLKMAIWIGMFIVFTAGPTGLYMFIDKYFYHNHAHFTSASSLSVLVVFLVGMMLVSIGIMGYYIASIHSEVSNRPLYVVRKPRRKIS